MLSWRARRSISSVEMRDEVVTHMTVCKGYPISQRNKIPFASLVLKVSDAYPHVPAEDIADAFRRMAGRMQETSTTSNGDPWRDAWSDGRRTFGNAREAFVAWHYEEHWNSARFQNDLNLALGRDVIIRERHPNKGRGYARSNTVGNGSQREAPNSGRIDPLASHSKIPSYRWKASMKQELMLLAYGFDVLSSKLGGVQRYRDFLRNTASKSQSVPSPLLEICGSDGLALALAEAGLEALSTDTSMGSFVATTSTTMNKMKKPTPTHGTIGEVQVYHLDATDLRHLHVTKMRDASNDSKASRIYCWGGIRLATLVATFPIYLPGGTFDPKIDLTKAASVEEQRVQQPERALRGSKGVSESKRRRSDRGSPSTFPSLSAEVKAGIAHDVLKGLEAKMAATSASRFDRKETALAPDDAPIRKKLAPKQRKRRIDKPKIMLAWSKRDSKYNEEQKKANELRAYQVSVAMATEAEGKSDTKGRFFACGGCLSSKVVSAQCCDDDTAAREVLSTTSWEFF